MNKTIKSFCKTLILAGAALVALPALSQDKLANMAPIDKKMKAIDSVAILKMVHQEALFVDPASNLYPSWNNEYTTNYGVELPSQYNIDLRGFCMPTTSRLVTSHYGYRRSFRRQHYGTDIKVYVGDTIRAAFTGKVRIVDYEGRGYGKYVIIRHPNGLETLYGHMSKQLVHEDDIVRAGDPIGLGGNTGRSTGSHLHFETRFLGRFIDPEKLFDFEAQDVLADYYVFRSSGAGVLVAAADVVGGESAEMTEAQALAMAEIAEKAQAKAEESRAFQEQKIAEHRKSRSAVHKVKSGENLSVIAKKYHTTVKKLCQINRIKENSTLRPGQILKYS